MTCAPDGRTIMQTTPIDLPRKGYETAVTFSPSGNLMRIESAFLAPEVQRIVAVFSEGLKMGAIKGLQYDFDPDIRYGSFFNPTGTNSSRLLFHLKDRILSQISNPHPILILIGFQQTQECIRHVMSLAPLHWMCVMGFAPLHCVLSRAPLHQLFL